MLSLNTLVIAASLLLLNMDKSGPVAAQGDSGPICQWIGEECKDTGPFDDDKGRCESQPGIYSCSAYEGKECRCHDQFALLRHMMEDALNAITE